MQKTLNILFAAVVLALFSVSAYAQVADKVFIETPDGKLVKLSVNGQTAMLGLRRLPTAQQVKVTGSPVVVRFTGRGQSQPNCVQFDVSCISIENIYKMHNGLI